MIGFFKVFTHKTSRFFLNSSIFNKKKFNKNFEENEEIHQNIHEKVVILSKIYYKQIHRNKLMMKSS